MSNIKNEIINNVVVVMSAYVKDKETLDVLEHMLANELMRVNVEEITTLPAEIKSSVDQRNASLVQLFFTQKRHLKKRTIEAYMGSVRRLVLATGKRLDLIDALDIDWYLAQYEKHKGVRTEQITNRTYNNERRNLSAFFTWMRKSKIIQDDSPYLFAQTRGGNKKMTTAGYRYIMRKIGKRAKIQSRVYPHKMRKTLGMDLKQHGLDIGIIQEILGHASPAVTSMYYAQSTTESLRSVRQRMSA